MQRDCVIPAAVSNMQSTDVSAAISTMERYGLIFKEPTSGKNHSLSSVATVSLTKVSKPVPVKTHPLTAFEARAELLGMGWQLVESAIECSIEKQRMMKFQCGGYFRLLMHHRDCLLELYNKSSILFPCAEAFVLPSD